MAYRTLPGISLLFSWNDKESADDADPAEHHHHHDQGQGDATLCGGDIFVWIGKNGASQRGG